ncbi:hypothetical protein [Varibaculum vaginae]|uniref:hypothetical protein n=1 Tax=Varibaculum vaginae TaxID=2364797 RepID=UPI0011C49B4D|nr:hypothetical protein [Varibaculum vaginae]
MNNSPDKDVADSKKSFVRQKTQRSTPYGPPGRVLPREQVPTQNRLLPSPPQLAGQPALLQPAALPPTAISGEVSPLSPQVNPVYSASYYAAGDSPTLASEESFSPHNIVVILLVIGIVIAGSYLGFLLFMLLKTHFMALPSSLSLPLSINALGQQVVNVSLGFC